REEMLAETSGLLQIQYSMLFDFHRIASPYDSLFRRVLQRKKSCNIRRPGKVEKACRSAVVLHEREPFKVVIFIGDVLKEMNGLSLEDSQDALFLIGPRALVDAKDHEIPRQALYSGAEASRCPRNAQCW